VGKKLHTHLFHCDGVNNKKYVMKQWFSKVMSIIVAVAPFSGHGVCLSVYMYLRMWLSARVSQKWHVQTSLMFFYMLPVTVARSSDNNAIWYIGYYFRRVTASLNCAHGRSLLSSIVLLGRAIFELYYKLRPTDQSIDEDILKIGHNLTKIIEKVKMVWFLTHSAVEMKARWEYWRRLVKSRWEETR